MEEIVRKAIEDHQRTVFHFQIIAVVSLVLYILFLGSLYRTMRRISPAFRWFPPAFVWLNLTPYIYPFWGIATVCSLTASLRLEARLRGKDDGSTYGRGVGVAAFVLSLFRLGLPLLQIWIWNPGDFIRTHYMLTLLNALYGVLFVGSWCLTFVYWFLIAQYRQMLIVPFRLPDGETYEENPMQFLEDEPVVTHEEPPDEAVSARQ